MKHTRRVAAAAAATLVVSLAACSSGGSTESGGAESSSGESSSSEQSLTIYTGRDKDEVADVVSKFEEAYPQYEGKVQTIIAGAQDNLDRLRAEKGNPQAGFLWGGTQQQLEQAASEGLFVKTSPTNLDSIPEKYRSADGTWYAEQLLPEVIIYNSNLLTDEEAPKDWDDLVTDAFKDSIVIRDVAASGTMRTIYAAMVYRFFAEDGTPDRGYEFLRKLDANTVSYAANPDDMYVQLDQGVGTVTLWNLQDALIQTIKNQHPWKYVIPESGAPVLLDGVAVVNNPSQEEAATDFMNFILEPKLQAQLAADYYQVPAVTVEDTDKPEWLRDLDLKEMDIDWDVFGEHQDEWMDYWTENIRS